MRTKDGIGSDGRDEAVDYPENVRDDIVDF